MPGGDGTGPLGMGSMTGRAAGYCAGYGVPGFANFYGYGRGLGGWGRGRGGGRGRGRWFPLSGFAGWPAARPAWTPVAPAWGAAPYGQTPAVGMTPQQEIDALKGQAEYLEDVLDGLRRRIQELEPKSANA
ncbi:MAG: DUF5320 domain-containing protein [Planctomycetaceae bacterium]|nr:DUF5320 domain-containing protein [Planctomycetaceae bacterium]